MLCLALACTAAFLSVVKADFSTEYSHHAALDPAEKMKLYWTVDWKDESVSFALEATTTGWVGFGISSGKGQMVGSDVVIGWVKDGKGYLKDRFADIRDLPSIDAQQDYTLTDFQESGGKTVLHFNRKFDTCDNRDRKIEIGTTKVVFAYHTEDPVSEIDMKQHTYRGSRSIQLLNNMETKTVNQTGWKTALITSRNVTVPARDTTYWCTLHKGLDVDTKHHIVKFEPYLQPGNEGMVHHLTVWECKGNFSEQDFGVGADCYDSDNSYNMPFPKCKEGNLVFAWAVGAEAFYWPPHAGYPISPGKEPTHFLLQLHYDNPDRISGRKDSSGIRLFYSSDLRKYDSGVFYIGISASPWHMIPPKQDSWITTGYCNSQCSQDVLNSSSLPGGGINVFSAFLHTHTTGRATWTKHIRKGKELPEIARDDNYDFNFQDIQVLRKEAHIHPGDDLIHYCKDNTMDRTKAVKGGLSTRDEMCLNYLFYYPAIPELKSCTSREFKPVYQFRDKYFSSVQMTSPFTNPLVDIDIKWNDSMVADFKTFYADSKDMNPTCLDARTLSDTKDPTRFMPKIQIDEPLPPLESSCFVAADNHASSLSGSVVALVLVLVSSLVVSFP